MSADALAIVRAFFDLANARDFAGVAACLDPDVVWFGTQGGLDELQVIRGPGACIAYLREIEEPWQQFEVTPERLIDLDDTIVALIRETGQARHADLAVQNETAMIFRVAGQKIVEARGYLDRDEALKAARQAH